MNPHEVLASGSELVLATHNPGKAAELQVLLRPHGVRVLEADALGLSSPKEGPEGFVENAVLKAVAAAGRSGRVALGDDTGLCIASLGGEPGVETAGFAEAHGGYDNAMRVLAERTGLLDGETVEAVLHCALALAWPDGRHVAAEAAVRGQLRWPPNSTIPGFAAFFSPSGADVCTDGVLVHRRRAFERLFAKN